MRCRLKPLRWSVCELFIIKRNSCSWHSATRRNRWWPCKRFAMSNDATCRLNSRDLGRPFVECSRSACHVITGKQEARIMLRGTIWVSRITCIYVYYLDLKDIKNGKYTKQRTLSKFSVCYPFTLFLPFRGLHEKQAVRYSTAQSKTQYITTK